VRVGILRGAIGAKAPFQPVLLAAPAVTPPGQRKAPKRRAPCEGSAFRLVCSCSVEWLQKSVAGAGSPQSLSVAAEREQRGLAPSGHPAKGEGACCLPTEGVLDRESRRPQRDGGGSDLDRPDASLRAKACGHTPDGDGASEVSPVRELGGSRMPVSSPRTSWPKPAERR
jgi:hypothetical protein